MAVVINSSFIGDFKVGDNICYNLRTLKAQYRAQAAAHDKSEFVKPIVLLIAAVLEAVLHDFHARIRHHTAEGVANLVWETVHYVQMLKKIDEFEKYIESAKKHDLFDQGPAFYSDLHELRKIRNRIHIQNLKKHQPRDEALVFTSRCQQMAEKLLERTMRVMAGKYSRGPKYAHVSDFELPWDAHFPEDRDIPF